MDRARVERLVRELLVELADDPKRPGLTHTPERFTELLASFDLRRRPPEAPAPPRPEAAGEMVILPDLAFVSLCEHHLLPFFGRCQIGCVPRRRSCEPAWCLELVSHFAHRPQLQERLTEQIAEALFQALEPEGLGVAIDGRHLCMMMRGVQKQESHIQTSSLRGSFLADPALRSSFFSQLSGPQSD